MVTATTERTKLGELTWTDLQASDLEKQTTFYESLFGWTHQDVPGGEGMPPYRMFYKDGVQVAGGAQLAPDSEMPTFWAVYLATPHLDATVAKATELGATVIMPTMDVMESGRMAAISDPTGGGIFFWEAGTHHGAGAFNGPGTIAWADLSTRDPQAAADFFKELLDWEIVQMGDPIPYWQFNVNGEGEGGVMGMPDMMPADARPFWTIYFGTDDMPASLAKAAELGGTVVAPPMAIGGGVSFAVLTDPAGCAFALLGPMQA